VISGASDVLGDAAQDRIGDCVLRAFDDRNVEAAGGCLALKLRAREELQEIDGLCRRTPGHQPAVEAAERVGRIALACGRGREGKPAELVVSDAFLVGRVGPHAVEQEVALQHHRPFAIPKLAG